MNGEIPFSARCAKCGNGSFAQPIRLELEADMVCKACGYQGKLVEFADLTTLDAILQRALKAPGYGALH